MKIEIKNKMKNSSLFIFIILLILLVILSFDLGLKFSSLSAKFTTITVGCWKKVSETDRIIVIRVNNRDLSEIIDTSRHELCHEIDYRLHNNTQLGNETFAETCKPEDYLYLDKEEKY